LSPRGTLYVIQTTANITYVVILAPILGTKSQLERFGGSRKHLKLGENTFLRLNIEASGPKSYREHGWMSWIVCVLSCRYRRPRDWLIRQQRDSIRGLGPNGAVLINTMTTTKIIMVI